jgi:glucans biosynthesis protein
MHGASGGAPKGNRNALKHGGFTAEAIEERRMVAALTKQARELVAGL